MENTKEHLTDIPKKTDQQLIEEWELYTQEDEFYYMPAYSHRQRFFYLSVRDEIKRRGLEKDELVTKADKRIIAYAIGREEKPYRQQMEGGLELWWWHLDKIRERTYPVELLPEHLRETYLYEDILSDWEGIVYDRYWLEHLCSAEYESAHLVSRDEIHQKGLDNHPRVVEADRALLRYVMEHGCVEHEDYEEHPLSEWWWHLSKLYEKTYPVELLPEHLRDLYQNS